MKNFYNHIFTNLLNRDITSGELACFKRLFNNQIAYINHQCATLAAAINWMIHALEDDLLHSIYSGTFSITTLNDLQESIEDLQYDLKQIH